uniref:Uncharacterized protein n=1 Tax=Anopheles minimus TaxID=112268 RepID=A0A182VYD9_9DIPT
MQDFLPHSPESNETWKARPPSSSISYTGQLNDDVRSPGSGSTPGPLSAQPPTGMDPADAAIKLSS